MEVQAQHSVAKVWLSLSAEGPIYLQGPGYLHSKDGIVWL